jgi:hypothetical protein
MFGTTNRPKQKRGRPVSSAAINAPHRLLDELSRLRGGRGTFWTPFGPQVAQPGTGFRVGITGSDGIPAGSGSSGSGPITLGYSSDVQDCWIQITQPGQATLMISDSSANFDGYNLSSSAVAPQAITIYMWLWNCWICIWEDCRSSGS